jgi:hypothetical protein
MTIGGPIDGVGFSPDGRVLACLTRKIEVVLYEIASRQERLCTPSPGARWITVFRGMIRFSPDGLWLASSGGDGAELWDAATGQLARPLSGGQGKVTDLSFSPDSRTVATAGSDTTILIWAVPERPPAAPLSSKDADTAWADLAADAATAYRAIHRLADDPARAAPFLAERLRLAPVPDPGQVARWVADLGDDRYPVREKATRELEAAGDHAETALRRLLAGRPTLEQRRRAERLLDRLGGPVTAPDRLREVRAVEALERMNTPDARRALEALAKGPAELMLTREAATALGRLRR